MGSAVKSLYPKVINLLWVLMLFFVPITSMPQLARLLGSDTVAAPSMIFLIGLVILWLIPYLYKGGTLPIQSIPLIVFFCVALLSTVAAFFIDIPTYKDFSVLSSNFQSIATLMIGICFYLVVSTFPKDDEILLRALRIINWAGFIVLVWAAMQIIAWHGFGHYPKWMFDLQGVISSRVLYRNRVTGMALEPSWFAHQLNLLFIPLWFAATIRKFSSHKWKVLGFTFENILFLCGVGALLLTLSRIGYLAFLCMISVVLVIINIRIVKYVSELILKKSDKENPSTQVRKKTIRLVLTLILILLYCILLLAGLYVLSKIDPRMQDIFNFSKDQDKDNPILRYLNNMQVGERVVYWMAGWDIFDNYPILGVGLGNAGFFLPQKITPYGWTLIEVRKLTYRMHVLLNIKNLWVRLLAETGIVGFSVFIGWLMNLAFNGFKLIAHKKKMVASLSLTGIFVLVALAAEGFSIDSFALPYLWISLGLMTGILNPGKQIIN